MKETTPSANPCASSLRKVCILTFGCQMNVYDSGKMLALLEQDGFRRTGDWTEADLILLNTCSVREKPEQKLRTMLGMIRGARDRGALIGVTGCMAQHDGARLFQRYPFVDLVVGPDALPRLREIVAAAHDRRVLDNRFLEGTEYPFIADLDPSSADRVAGFVTIQKGCDNHCTYCIVPYVRGTEISRPHAEVLAEVQGLVERGVRDITLIGQNVNSYGRKRDGEIDFATLLRSVHAVEGLLRLRFTTSHPRDLDDATLDSWRDLPRLASHLHLPVQSGSDRILRRMNRKYDRAHYIERIRGLQAARPAISITTDLIVGFPGETDEDFAETMSLMEEVPFDGCFSFKYSPRPHTPAQKLHEREPVSADVASKRLDILQRRQQELSQTANQGLVGSRVEVLLEGPSHHDPEVMEGRSSCFRMVNVRAPGHRPGDMVQVRITQGNIHTLSGVLDG